MRRPPVSQFVLKQIPLERFLEMDTDELRVIRDELAGMRSRRGSPLDRDAIESLIRVMDRNSFETVSHLGRDAAKAWAGRVGVRLEHHG
jgi:hypothetical protein